jgi:hypothetical protein
MKLNFEFEISDEKVEKLISDKIGEIVNPLLHEKMEDLIKGALKGISRENIEILFEDVFEKTLEEKILPLCKKKNLDLIFNDLVAKYIHTVLGNHNLRIKVAEEIKKQVKEVIDEAQSKK